MVPSTPSPPEVAPVPVGHRTPRGPPPHWLWSLSSVPAGRRSAAWCGVLQPPEPRRRCAARVAKHFAAVAPSSARGRPAVASTHHDKPQECRTTDWVHHRKGGLSSKTLGWLLVVFSCSCVCLCVCVCCSLFVVRCSLFVAAVVAAAVVVVVVVSDACFM